jgi:citrate synthase
MRLNIGLENIAVRNSNICKIDGGSGDIWYRGYHLDELVENSSFEETMYLLWYDDLPSRSELIELKKELEQGRELPDTVINIIREIAPLGNAMDILRMSISLLRHSEIGEHREAFPHIVSKSAVILAYTYRVANGLDFVEPKQSYSHAENFLYMMTAEEPSAEAANALDGIMIAYAEHGMNASTFAGTVSASTGASIYSALNSSISALEGPLHGGAANDAMRMLRDINNPDDVAKWIEKKQNNNERIPGFGHRIYNTTDPRCSYFEHYINMFAKEGDRCLLEIANTIQRESKRYLDENIYTNTDLYSGLFYQTIGLPSEYSTQIFAISRMVGWLAHIFERQKLYKLLRPRIRYSGDINKQYVPVSER